MTGATYTTCSYDANGNQIGINANGSLTTYTWDDENRLTGVTNSDNTFETYTYAADNLRRKKETNSGSTLFLYDNQNLLLETDLSFVVQARYSNAPYPFDGPYHMLRSGVKSNMMWDMSQNIVGLANYAGVVTDKYIYKAFGDELSITGSTVNPFRFGGKVGYYRDAVSRLYVRARHLSTNDGRWSSRDPMWALNLYDYVVNNPLRLIDPLGLQGIGTGIGLEPPPILDEPLPPGIGNPYAPGPDPVSGPKPGPNPGRGGGYLPRPFPGISCPPETTDDCIKRWKTPIDIVHDACDIPGGRACEKRVNGIIIWQISDCNELLRRAALNDLCYRTRLARDNDCNLTDPKHEQQRIDAENAAKRCRDIAEQKGCQGPIGRPPVVQPPPYLPPGTVMA